MSINHCLAYLSARSAQLPTGENSRLEATSISGINRYTLSFSDSATQECLWTIPRLPEGYQNTQSLSLKVQYIMASATSGNVVLGAQIESISSGDTLDLDTSNSFDTANTATIAVPTTAGFLVTASITLTSNDNIAAGDYIRIRFFREGANASDTASGNLNLLGVSLEENVVNLVMSGYSQVLGNAGSSSAPFYSFVQPNNGTGIFSINTDNLAFSTAQQERMRIDFDGYAGINVVPSTTARLWVKDATTLNGGTGVFSQYIGDSIGTCYGIRAEASGLSDTNVGISTSATNALNNYALIAPSGYVGIGTSFPSYRLHAVESQNASIQFGLENTSSTFTGTMLKMASAATAGSGWSFLTCTSSGSDTKFILKGDGNALCDGSFTGGGADYAEYFEWEDGNKDNEDRVGSSVAIVNGKIRIAQKNDKPIGIVSANPTVVGDSAWNHWSNKYLVDDFGRIIYEDINVIEYNLEGRIFHIEAPEDAILTEADKLVTLKKPSLNPNFDPQVKYVPRSERKEWGCIGLMGKLRIKKNQIVNNNWIKIRDISDSIEEWLIK